MGFVQFPFVQSLKKQFSFFELLFFFMSIKKNISPKHGSTVKCVLTHVAAQNQNPKYNETDRPV